MMLIKLQPEPTTFQKEVRELGQNFLRKHPQPTTRKNHEHWRKAIPDLYKLYDGICSYSVEWIPQSLTDPTIDHFVPKSKRPDLAYKWNNFRLACNRFNRLKSNHEDVLDPFMIGSDWFWIHFPSLQLMPNRSLPELEKVKVRTTINRLQLNNRLSIESRERWILSFRDTHISFEFLKRNAPLIAHELERQGLIDKLNDIMKN